MMICAQENPVDEFQGFPYSRLFLKARHNTNKSRHIMIFYFWRHSARYLYSSHDVTHLSTIGGCMSVKSLIKTREEQEEG